MLGWPQRYCPAVVLRPRLLECRLRKQRHKRCWTHDTRCVLYTNRHLQSLSQPPGRPCCRGGCRNLPAVPCASALRTGRPAGLPSPRVAPARRPRCERAARGSVHDPEPNACMLAGACQGRPGPRPQNCIARNPHVRRPLLPPSPQDPRGALIRAAPPPRIFPASPSTRPRLPHHTQLARSAACA